MAIALFRVAGAFTRARAREKIRWGEGRDKKRSICIKTISRLSGRWRYFCDCMYRCLCALSPIDGGVRQNVSNRKKVNVKGIRFVGFLHSGKPVFGVGFVRRGGRRITIQNPERGYPKAASGVFETDERIKPKARISGDVAVRGEAVLPRRGGSPHDRVRPRP